MHEVIEALDNLCDAEQHAAVIDLTEHAHRCADEAIGYVDDSDGWLTIISERLAELHLRACADSRQDPVELAERLVNLELHAELDGFHRAALTYVDVLGPTGLAAYRELVEPRWQAIRDDDEPYGSGRFAIREARIAVALAAGDPDELIGVRAADLRTPGDHLEIARALLAAGRGDDEAEQWARTGIDAFPERAWQTTESVDFLVSRLRARGADEEVEQLLRQVFERSPSLKSYRCLLTEADGSAVASCRDWSIELLRTRAAKAATGTPTGRPAGSVLVEVLAYDGRADEAWQAATDHGCTPEQWMMLARAREDSHPIEAIEVYEPEVIRLIDAKKNQTYRQAVDLLTRIHRLARRADQPELFDRLLTTVRDGHSRKRNLMKLLNQKPL